MKLIQLLLPLYDNTGKVFPRQVFEEVHRELAVRFGGVTAYARAPAVGLWEDDAGEVRRDDVVLFEVMADALDHAWWRQYRQELENRFRQEAIVVRASEVDLL